MQITLPRFGRLSLQTLDVFCDPHDPHNNSYGHPYVLCRRVTLHFDKEEKDRADFKFVPSYLTFTRNVRVRNLSSSDGNNHTTRLWIDLSGNNLSPAKPDFSFSLDDPTDHSFFTDFRPSP